MSDNNFPNSKLFMTEAERKRYMRENETPGERALRLEKRQTSRRLEQSDAETAERLECQRERQEVLRQIESEDQSADRLESSANSRRPSDKVSLKMSELFV